MPLPLSTTSAGTRKFLFLPLLPLPPLRAGQRLSAELVDPAQLLRCPESTRHSEQLHLLLHILLATSSASSFLLAANAEAARKRKEAESTTSVVASARDGVASDGRQEHWHPACSETSCSPGSLRAPGCVPGGGVLCFYRASCASCTTSSLTLAIFGRFGAVWCVISARVIATVIRSCRSHEQSRRCRLRAAAVAVSTPTLVDIIKAQLKSHQHKTEQPV